MMLEVIVTIVALFVSPEHAGALASTAPRYLTHERAREHIAAAVVAAAATRADPFVLLSVAHHESRYDHRVVTREPNHPRTGAARWSCGAMTPEPLIDFAECMEATRSPAASYLAGARHLRAWMDACERMGSRDVACALRGYGGKAAPRFIARAAWIRRALARRNAS